MISAKTMLRGVNPLNLDAKGRVAVPTRYRQLLTDLCEGKLVATIDTQERCLLIYPLFEWEVIQEKIEALPSFDPAARRIQRLLIGYATDLDMDGAGRLLLPATLREYAGLEKKAMLLGQGNKFELWNEDTWNAKRDDYLIEQDQPKGLSEEIQQLSL